MRLRVFAWCLALGIVATLIACGGLPTRSNRPASINVSGEELAPVATLPSGAPAARHDPFDVIAAALGAQPSPERPSTSGRPVREDFVPCGGCGDCGCCGYCGCGCCSCSCSAFGGGAGGLTCVMNAASISSGAASCGGNDVWDLAFQDSDGVEPTPYQAEEATACTPNPQNYSGGATACMPYNDPGGNGTCTSAQQTVHPGEPPLAVISATDAYWTQENEAFTQNSGYCDGTACQFDMFSEWTSGNAGGPISAPVCN
jgi:hypothetical protein